MANVKRVKIVGDIPFCFMDDVESGGTLDDGDLAFLARLLLGPHGLKLRWNGVHHMQDNENGGSTTYYGFTIQGEEALRWGTMHLLADTLRKAGANLNRAWAKDIEDTPSLTFDLGSD